MRNPLAPLRRYANRIFLPLDRDIDFRNREGVGEYDFTLLARQRPPGVSAMLRARNESEKIITCLSSILGVFDEIVFIDNGSTDGTLDQVLNFKAEFDLKATVVIRSYPHAIARCGAEHRATPADSLHSLVYYYNWCLSQCRYRYVFKWDADMALAANGTEKLNRLFAALPCEAPALWSVNVQTIYRDLQGVWYLATDEVNAERRLAPNQPSVRYRKAKHWERLASDLPLRRRKFEPVCIYEMKDTATDEFSHWSSIDFPTPRKRREYHNFQLVKQGHTAEPRFQHLPHGFTEHRLTRRGAAVGSSTC